MFGIWVRQGLLLRRWRGMHCEVCGGGDEGISNTR